jgi:streptogramin lyase
MRKPKISDRAITSLTILFLGGAVLMFAGRYERSVARARIAAERASLVLIDEAGAAVGELKVTIKEWDVPTKGAHPHDPALAPDGSLWFTEQLQNKLGRLDPASGAFKEYPLKIEDSGPHGLVADSN